nr:MAG TPA: hypothetical protein [Caudoviricetes sp.]
MRQCKGFFEYFYKLLIYIDLKLFKPNKKAIYSEQMACFFCP